MIEQPRRPRAERPSISSPNTMGRATLILGDIDLDRSLKENEKIDRKEAKAQIARERKELLKLGIPEHIILSALRAVSVDGEFRVESENLKTQRRTLERLLEYQPQCKKRGKAQLKKPDQLLAVQRSIFTTACHDMRQLTNQAQFEKAIKIILRLRNAEQENFLQALQEKSKEDKVNLNRHCKIFAIAKVTAIIDRVLHFVVSKEASKRQEESKVKKKRKWAHRVIRRVWTHYKSSIWRFKQVVFDYIEYHKREVELELETERQNFIRKIAYRDYIETRELRRWKVKNVEIKKKELREASSSLLAMSTSSTVGKYDDKEMANTPFGKMVMKRIARGSAFAQNDFAWGDRNGFISEKWRTVIKKPSSTLRELSNTYEELLNKRKRVSAIAPQDFLDGNCNMRDSEQKLKDMFKSMKIQANF